MSAPRFLYIIIPRSCGGVKKLIDTECLRSEYISSTVGKAAALLLVEIGNSFVNKDFFKAWQAKALGRNQAVILNLSDFEKTFYPHFAMNFLNLRAT